MGGFEVLRQSAITGRIVAGRHVIDLRTLEALRQRLTKESSRLEPPAKLRKLEGCASIVAEPAAPSSTTVPSPLRAGASSAGVSIAVALAQRFPSAAKQKEVAAQKLAEEAAKEKLLKVEEQSQVSRKVAEE